MHNSQSPSGIFQLQVYEAVLYLATSRSVFSIKTTGSALAITHNSNLQGNQQLNNRETIMRSHLRVQEVRIETGESLKAPSITRQHALYDMELSVNTAAVCLCTQSVH